ncbi:hypothetical protein EV127DRAFT_415634 [Xylaria flabelliformis]|nr:hypothetical protein EV127DRAFT_415634 [Xylaria flabelliformis]
MQGILKLLGLRPAVVCFPFLGWCGNRSRTRRMQAHISLCQDDIRDTQDAGHIIRGQPHARIPLAVTLSGPKFGAIFSL